MGNEASTTQSKAPITLDVPLKWKQISAEGAIPHGREGHCSISYKDDIYIFGGGYTSETNPIQSNELFRFSPSKFS
jgi:hypothetical protein